MNASGAMEIVDRLVAAEIPFVVIGGHAVNAHGFIRATEDVDILFERTEETQQRLYEILRDINAYYIGTEIDPQTGIERIHDVTMEYVQTNHLLMLGSNLGYLDIFDFVPGVAEGSVAEVLRSAITIDDRPFVDLNWLRRMKMAAGRPQDQIDLQNLPDP
jgi:hypothetical protein